MTEGLIDLFYLVLSFGLFINVLLLMITQMIERKLWKSYIAWTQFVVINGALGFWCIQMIKKAFQLGG